jgi:predicted DNA binding CopG/RHH family protein
MKYFDNEEKVLSESLENDEWVSDIKQNEKKTYMESARYSLNKQKRINIRMTERDLKKIQAKSIKACFHFTLEFVIQ